MGAGEPAISESPEAEATDVFEQAVRTVQFLAVDAIERANSGHPGAPMALAAIGVDLFSRYLRYNPEDPQWPNRDRFILSCGHASMLLYSLLHLSGYDLSLQDLKDFRQLRSPTPGHPEVGETPGVETTTGLLGQGLSNGVGMALAAKMVGARINTADSTLIDYRVFVIASDGDLMEGITNEAASIAGHLGLDNLIVIHDDNRITIDGSTDLTFTEDVGARHEAHGWFAQRVDGHDPEQVRAALDRAVAEPQRPSLIIARTCIGRGAPTKQGTAKCHGAPLGTAEAEATKRAAGWPLEPFYVPDGVRELFGPQVARNQQLYQQWKNKLAAVTTERADLWQKLTARAVPDDLFARLVTKVRPRADATRFLASDCEQIAAALVPALIQGSGDLTGSTRSAIVGSPIISRGNYEGRNLHYGVREHAMGAIMNGLALSGFFIPAGSTFLIFSDYMRPAIRMAAVMKQQVIYIFTHDSIFVGEDGPTHQPSEQLWALRAIPNLDVVRPADALECAAAWDYALTRRTGPTALVLSRQCVPSIEHPYKFDPEQVRKGAYILADSRNPDLVMIATGSEVHAALKAKQILASKGKRARVVSAPCWQAFERLPQREQEATLGRGLPRVTVEAGTTRGWRGVVGPDGLAIGIDTYGVSAPAHRLAEEFGLTGEAVAERILEQL